MPEIEVRRHSRMSRLRQRVRGRVPLLVGVAALAGITGLTGAMVALGPARDVMLTLPSLPAPAVVAPPVPVVPAEQPAGGGDENETVSRREPRSGGSATAPVAVVDTSSGARSPEGSVEVPVTDDVDLPTDGPGPATPPAQPQPPPPPPATPEPEPTPEPPGPSEPPAPEQPDPVRQVVDDVTGLTPVTEPIGDLVDDLLGPPR